MNKVDVFSKKHMNNCLQKERMVRIILGVMLVIVACGTIGFSLYCNLLGSLVIGIVSGLLSALIFDFFSRCREQRILNEVNRNNFYRLKSDLDHSCEELIYVFIVAAQEYHGYDEQKRTFAQWVKYLFIEQQSKDNKNNQTVENDVEKKDEEKRTNEIRYAMQQVGEIRKEASKLRDISKYNLGNSYFDDHVKQKLERLIRGCERVMVEVGINNMEGASRELSNNLVGAISEWSEEIGESLKTPFNFTEE